MEIDRSDFFHEIAYSLTGCQLVEQELKLYIAEALELVRKYIGNRVPFYMSGEDYEDASLERLIGTFRKLTSNKDLVKQLGKFKAERNFLSHQGITHCLDPDGDLDFPTAEEFRSRLDWIQHESSKLREAIHVEANKFRGSLWFEEFPGSA